MRRPVLLAFAPVVLALAGCSDGGRPEPSPTPVASPSPSATATTASSPTASPSVSPTFQPELQLPADAPVAFEGVLGAGGPFDELVPPGSEVLDAWFQQASSARPAFVGVVWGRGDDPLARELGLVVWERFPDEPAWRAVHAFTDGPASGVLGISLAVADLTNDGVEDALTFEHTGGTGACGTWRVIAPVHGAALEAMRRRTCDAEIAIVGAQLELTEAVYAPDDAHCCPSAFRTTTLEWDGAAFVQTDVREEPAG